MYTNYYVHHGMIWSDHWDCMCNDECAVCHGKIEPFMSEDEGEIIMHVTQDFIPENGWPEGILNLEELIDAA